MKKFILMAGLLLASLAQAQDYTVTTDGNPITEGQEFVFNTLGETTAKLHFLIHNNTNADHNFNIVLDEISNNTSAVDGIKAGTLQLCFNTTCYNEIRQGGKYPGAAGSAILAGGTNDIADHLYNAWGGDNTSEPVIYKMTLQMTDDSANPVKIVSFTYKYSATAGLTDFASLENMGINVQNTVVKNTLDITANVNAKLEVYNISGQSVKKVAIANGAQAIDLSGLSAGVYIARFATEENKTSQIRIVKN